MKKSEWHKQNNIILNTLKQFGIDNVHLYYDTNSRFCEFGSFLLRVSNIDKNFFMDLYSTDNDMRDKISHVIVDSVKFEINDSLLTLLELAVKYLSKSHNPYKADVIISISAYLNYYNSFQRG